MCLVTYLVVDVLSLVPHIFKVFNYRLVAVLNCRALDLKMLTYIFYGEKTD